MSCTTPATVSGVAKFTNCVINKAGTGYKLTATADGFSVTSSAFNVLVGPVAKVVFTQQPPSIQAGNAFSPAPTATVEDAGGNTVTSSTDDVGLFVDPSTSSLSCTGSEKTAPSGGVALAVTNGSATFSGCTIDESSSGTDVLVAVATDGTTNGTYDVQSSPFSVYTGSATQLAFQSQPTGAQSGFAFSQQPAVAIEDGAGNVVSSAGDTITLTITPTTGTSGANLSCSTQAASDGVAYFSDCGIDTAGTGYTLTATDGNLSVTSAPFDVSAGGTGGISWATQPGDGLGGQALSSQPDVTLTGISGNPVSGSVQLSLKGGPAGAVLTCAINPTPAGEGTAQFSGCSVNLAGTYQLVAADTADAAITATSDSFTVSPGAAAQLGFVQSPTSATGGTAFATQPVVAVEDLGGNPVDVPGSSVRLSITPGTGSPGATLSCSNNPRSVDPSTSLATFSDCNIDKDGSGYELTATGDGFVATSAPFTVHTGTAARLVFTVQPNGGIANSGFGTQPQVSVADAGGNPIGPASATVSLTVSTGSLSCVANPVAADPSTGTAVFAGCQATTIGSGEYLTASANGLLSATSAPFNVTGGTPLGAAPVSLPLGQTFGGALYSRNPTSTVDDVNSATGALELSYTDLKVAGIGEPFTLTRTYNSLDTTGGSFGPGWSSILDAGVTVASNGTTALVRGDDGQQVVFTSNGHGGWVAPAGARETLSCSGTSCTVVRFDGVTWQSVGGHIQTYLSADGQGLHFKYTNNVLTQILVERSSTSLIINVTENASHEVTSLTTPTRSVDYSYSGVQLTGYTDADGNSWTYAYSGGQLIQVIDPLGGLRLEVTYANNRVSSAESLGSQNLFNDTYTWNASTQVSTRGALVETPTGLDRGDYIDRYKGNVLLSQQSPSGGVSSYSYDSQFNLLAMQSPLNLVQQMTYDAVGDITSQTLPFLTGTAAVTKFAYNAAHQLTSETDANGNVTTYAYTGNNLSRTTAPGSSTTTYKYNAYGERTETDGPLGIVVFTYDAAGNQTGFQNLTLSRVSLNGLGPVSSFNEAGQVLVATDARGHTSSGLNPAYQTVSTYDADGNLLSTTTPGPQTTSTTYDAAGDVTSTTSASGVVTSYTWNGTTNTFTSTSPQGSTSLTFDPSGDQLTNASGETLTYNPSGEETSMTDLTGITTTYTYDAAGNVIASSDDDAHSASYVYGANGQLASSTVNGVTSSTTYDPMGNVLTQTNNAGQVTTFTYNSQELVSSVTNAAGVTRYVYDPDGNLVQMVDGDGHVTYYTYNGANQRTSMVVNGHTWTYAYDNANNLISSTDPDGRTTSYTLNAQDLPVATTYSQPGQSTISISATYNAAGQRTSMTDPTTGTHTYTYDGAGNLTEMSNGSHDTFTYDYNSPSPGEMTETYPSGATVTYTFDDQHNVMSVASGTVAISYLRNATRQVTGIAYSNGQFETQSYDATGNVTNQSLSCAGAVQLYTATSYDANGNPMSSLTTNGQTTATSSYGYDGTGRVVAQSASSATSTSTWDPGAACTSGTETTANAPNGGNPSDTSPNTTTPSTVGAPVSILGSAPNSGTSANPLTYDAVGNRLSDAGTTSTYNAANELVSQSGRSPATYTYDNSGDLTSETTSAGTTTYAYNAADELSHVTSPTSTITYTYDGDGNRVSEVVTGAGAMTEHFAWDESTKIPLLAEETDGNYNLLRRYIYGVGPVAMQTPTATYYLYTDANDDVTAVSSQTGAILESIQYDAFGNATVTAIDGATPVTEPILFQGQYLDAASGLYDLRARNYDPTTGRFTQRDPVIQLIGVPVVSPYIYAGDQPTTSADPTGLDLSSAADSAFDGHSTESASIVADVGYGVKATKILRGGILKLSKYFADAEEAAAPAENVVADASPELEEVAGDNAGAEADVAGKALSVIGIGLSAYVTYEDCNAYHNGSGSLSQCVGDSVGLAFAVGCLAVSDGIGSVACGMVGAAVAIVISKYGPQIYQGLSDLWSYTVEGAQLAYPYIEEGFNDAKTWLTGAYGSVRAGIDQGVTSAVNWTENAYNTAAGAIVTGFDTLSSALSSGFESALSTLEQAGYTAVQMADYLKGVFDEGIQQVAEFLNQLQYGAQAVMSALKSAFAATAEFASQVLKDLDYTVNQIAGALKSAYQYVDQAVAEVLQGLSYGINQIAGALEYAFSEGADAVAYVLNALNYAIDAIAGAMHTVFAEIDTALVATLNYIGATLAQISTALHDVYTYTLQQIANLYNALSYTATEVAQALSTAFGAIDSAVGSILKAAGYALQDIASALQSVFTDAAQAISSILKSIGYAASEIESWLSNVLGETTQAIENILSDIGFSSATIDAIGSAFQSFGNAVASGFESLGNDIASLF